MTLLECVAARRSGARAPGGLRSVDQGACARRRAGDLPARPRRGHPAADAAQVLRARAGRAGGAGAGAAGRCARSCEHRVQNLLEIDPLGQSLRRSSSAATCMIYFDRPIQQRVVSMLERHLAPGGYLFIAHSESLNGIDARPAVGGAGHLSEEAVVIEADGTHDRWRHSRSRRRRDAWSASARWPIEARPGGVIVTHALGSCIAVCIFDPVARVGGLLHFLLPESRINPDAGAGAAGGVRRHRHPAAVSGGVRAGAEQEARASSSWSAAPR